MKLALISNQKKSIIKISEKYYRPAEVDLLIGDPTKAKIELDWSPDTSFESLVQLMSESDIRRFS